MKKRMIYLLFTICVICSAALILAACQSYYGTYYGGYPNDPEPDILVISGNRATFSNAEYTYTRGNNMITLSSGVDIYFAEKNQVAYFSDSYLNVRGSISTRNGFFEAKLINTSVNQVLAVYEFFQNGTFTFKVFQYSAVTVTDSITITGTYYLKDGVLSKFIETESGSSSYLTTNKLHFWYIDESYNIFSCAMVKDYTKFQKSHNDDTGNNSNNGNSNDEGNYSITYNADGGIMPDDCLKSFSASNSDVLPYTLPIPTKQGVNFVGWYETADFFGEPVTVIPQGSYRNYVLYAKYSDEDILEYELSFDETYYSVIGYNGSPHYVTVPSTKDGLPVKELGVKAFENCNTLVNILLPDSICKIGGNAFSGCVNLSSICLPDNVTSIGVWAFANCEKLTSIVLPEGVTSIGSGAFAQCRNLTNITMPKSLTSIENMTFSSCNSLMNITIPEGVTTIGQGAFKYCNALTQVIIPEGVTTIGQGAFEYCNALTQVIIPEGVTYIDDWAFSYCKKLKDVTFPEGLEIIGLCAFDGCENLSDITLPNSIISVGRGAFSYKLCKRYYNCYYLPTQSGDYDFLYRVISNEVTNVRIHKDCKIINGSAFSDCSGLTEITIPDNVTKITWSAFRGCNNLQSVTIGNGVTSIGNSAFSGCDELKTVYYKGSVDQWATIDIEDSNIDLTNATRYYYSENEPNLNVDGTAYDGNYWRYVDNVPTIWKKEN